MLKLRWELSLGETRRTRDEIRLSPRRLSGRLDRVASTPLQTVRTAWSSWEVFNWLPGTQWIRANAERFGENVQAEKNAAVLGGEGRPRGGDLVSGEDEW